MIAVPAKSAKPCSERCKAWPNRGKLIAARRLKRKITEMLLAISSSPALITGAVAAIAEPPQIAEPTPIRIADYCRFSKAFLKNRL